MLETIDTESIPLVQGILVYAFIMLCLAILLMMIFHFRRNPPDWQNLAEKLKVRPWSAREAETVLLAIISVMLAGRAIIKAFYDLGTIPADAPDSYLLAAQTFLFDLPVIILMFALLIRSKALGKGILGYRPAEIMTAMRRGILLCLAVMPVIMIVAVLQYLLLTQAGFEKKLQLPIELLTRQGPLWIKIHLVFMSVVTAPALEEFIFRGIGISALADKTGIKWAVIIMSLAFAAIHLNLFAFGPLLVIALALSLVYIYTGSLLTPILMHSAFNALNIVALFLFKQGA